jgi:hypothetical protein
VRSLDLVSSVQTAAGYRGNFIEATTPYTLPARRGYTIGDAGDASLPTGLTKKILRPLNYGRRAQTGGHIVI